MGIAPEHDSASIAWVVSSYARGQIFENQDQKLADALKLLEELRLKRYDYPCWGYHYDFQSRVFFYGKDEPNTIATTYAGMAFLDAYERTGDAALLEQAHEVG